MSNKKIGRKINKLLLISLLPYLISLLIIYLPYLFSAYTYLSLPNVPNLNTTFLSWFTHGLIFSSILYIATIILLYFITLKKQFNIFLLLSLFVNLFFVTIVIFYKYTPLLDFVVYDSAQSKLCSEKTISQLKETDLEIKTFCNRIDLKPRDKIINYTVSKEDTVETIAQQFSISSNTIRWENNLASDLLNEGQILKILPVTGISYFVKKGDTLDSIALRFKTTKQKIIDYPFNNYVDPEKFTLIPGEILIIPDGIK